MALELELETFRRSLPSLLADPANHGKHVLISGDVVDSIWPTDDEAIDAGYDRFGLKTFMVKRIVEKEESVYSPDISGRKCASTIV